MFCPNCGNEMENGARFCRHCGAQLEKKTAADAALPAENCAGNMTAASKKPIAKKLVAAVAAAVVIVATGIFVCSKSSNTVDVNKYVTVSFEGHDGEGRAFVEVDSEKLYKDWGKKLQVKDKDIQEACEYYVDNYVIGPEDAKNVLKEKFGTEILRGAIESSYMLDHSSRLSNGDKVTLNWRDEDYVNWDRWMLDSVVGSRSLEDVLDIKLKMDDKSFKVKGLE